MPDVVSDIQYDGEEDPSNPFAEESRAVLNDLTKKPGCAEAASVIATLLNQRYGIRTSETQPNLGEVVRLFRKNSAVNQAAFAALSLKDQMHLALRWFIDRAQAILSRELGRMNEPGSSTGSSVIEQLPQGLQNPRSALEAEVNILANLGRAMQAWVTPSPRTNNP